MHTRGTHTNPQSEDNGPGLVPIPDPDVEIWIDDEVLEDYLGEIIHCRLEGGSLEDFDSLDDLVRLLDCDGDDGHIVVWIHGCVLFLRFGEAGQFDDDVLGDDVIAIATGVFKFGFAELAFGTIFLCYARQDTPKAKDEILHVLFANSMLGKSRAHICGLYDIDSNLLARIVDSKIGRVFSCCSFEAKASIQLANNDTCPLVFEGDTDIYDDGTCLVDHMISSGMELTALSISGLSLLSFRNLVRLCRSSKERGSAPFVELLRDYRVAFSFDHHMYDYMNTYDDDCDGDDDEGAADRAMALVRSLNVSTRISFSCNGDPLSREEIDAYRTLHQEGRVKELEIRQHSQPCVDLTPLYSCVPSVSVVSYYINDANIKYRPYLSGVEKLRGLRSIRFEIDEEAGGQPDDLVTSLAATIEEHGLIVGIYGLAHDTEIITSAVVNNMQEAGKSAIYMVPHLLGRKGLSLNERHEFLRRVGGSLPYTFGISQIPMVKASAPAGTKQLIILDWLSKGE